MCNFICSHGHFLRCFSASSVKISRDTLWDILMKRCLCVVRPACTCAMLCEPFGCPAPGLEKGPRRRRAASGLYLAESARFSHVWLIYREVFWTLPGWSRKSEARRRNEDSRRRETDKTKVRKRALIHPHRIAPLPLCLDAHPRIFRIQRRRALKNLSRCDKDLLNQTFPLKWAASHLM